ncbi:MAG TPA: TIM-barrel domain-containing protein, partial [Phycisphaerae bacterium]|nr:TIM-barrel domain-containing protein [Phycisphaerae bacterium]
MKKHLTVAALMACLPGAAFAEQLKIAGTPVEITVSGVTARTLRVDVSPLDDAGKPKATPKSMVMEPSQIEPNKEKISGLYKDTSELKENVSVGNLKYSIKAAPITVTFFKPDGKVLQELKFRDTDGSFAFHTEAVTVGLGEGRQQFDRRGYYFNFQNGQNTLLQTHGATVPSPFLIGVDGWGMFIHNPSPNGARQPNMAWGQFDMRGEDVPPLVAGGRGGAANADTNLTPPAERPTRGRYIPRQDTLGQAPTTIYVMNLDTPSDAFAEYMTLVGKPLMPPKWVMGYMQSHRSLQDAKEVLGVAKRLRDDKIPCDAVIYLGTGYTIAQGPGGLLGGWNQRNGRLDFNPDIFAKPQEMIDQLHDYNLKIVLHKTNAPANLHGSLYDENVPANDLTHVANYWGKPAREDTVTHTSLMAMGIDGWWPDDGDELPVENRLARIQLYYAGPLKDRPNERPWSLSRNGYSGVAKYATWNWSGDVNSTWATLQAHVPMGVQFSLSLSPWWGTDIGGFVGTPQYSGELYTRWYQFGAFNPLFRSHGRNWRLHTPWGWNDGDPDPRLREGAMPAAGTNYHDAAVEPACQKADNLRYQLLPYNYTITREACDSGMPPMRALLLAYPNDPVAVPLGDEYLWGPDILVAPVIERGATQRHLYLPAGEWHDFNTGEKITGGKWVDKPVTLETIPLYVKAGAIVPMDPVRQYTAEKVSEPTTLRVYPGADGMFTLYDDDGHTQGYLDGKDASIQWIKMTWTDAAKKLVIEADPRMKVPAGYVRTFRVQIGADAAGVKTVE